MKALAAILLLSLAAAAQSTIKVPVTVSDSAGNGVPGLAKDDFVVERNGKAIPVESVTQPPEAAPALALQPGRFSNIGLGAAGKGLIVIVLDTIHTRYSDEHEIRAQLLHFLRDAAQAKRPVSLFVLTSSGLKLVHNYTTLPDVLLAALDAADGELHKREPNANLTSEARAEAARLVALAKGEGTNPTVVTEPLHVAIRPVLDLFRDLAEAGAGIPGRKTIVWLTTMAPFWIENKTHLLESPSGSSISPGGFTPGSSRRMLTDDELRALQPFWRATINALVENDVAVMPIVLGGPAYAGLADFSITTLKQVAELTGGQEYQGSNSPLAPVEAMFGHSPATYQLELPDCESKSDWCSEKITLHQREGKVFAPAGEFREALPEKVVQGADVAAALAAPYEYSAIGFVAAWRPPETGLGEKRRMTFAVALPPNIGIIDYSTGAVHLEVAVSASTAGAELKEHAIFDPVTIPAASLEAMKKQPLVMNNAIVLEPGEYNVKIVVHDTAHDRYGSVTTPLKVQ